MVFTGTRDPVGARLQWAEPQASNLYTQFPSMGTSTSAVIPCTDMMTTGSPLAPSPLLPSRQLCIPPSIRGSRQLVLGERQRSLLDQLYVVWILVKFVICASCHYQPQSIFCLIEQWPEARTGLHVGLGDTCPSSQGVRGWVSQDLPQAAQVPTHSQSHTHTLTYMLPAAAHAVEPAMTQKYPRTKISFFLTSGWHFGTFPPF